MNIITERLMIRDFTSTDWPYVHEYTSDAVVMKYIPEGVFTREDTIKFVNENTKGNAKYFPVVLKDNQALIGHILFHKYFGNHTYEIGSMLQKLHFLY